MSYFRTNDPDRDFDILDLEQERRRARHPYCDDCGERIDDEHYFDVDGDILCEECLKDRYQRFCADYMD